MLNLDLKRNVLILVIVCLVSGLTWLKAKIHYRGEYFDVVKEHFLFREVKHCEDLIAGKTEEESLELKNMYEGCVIFVGVMVEELELQKHGIIYNDKAPNDAYKDAKARALKKINEMYGERE